MKVTIPQEHSELIHIFYPYLRSLNTQNPTLRDDAPQEAREAFEKYMALPKNTEIQIDSEIHPN